MIFRFILEMKVKIYVLIILIKFFNLNALPHGLKRQANQFQTVDVSFITPDQNMILNPPLEIESTTLPNVIDQISTIPAFIITDQQTLSPSVIIASPIISSLESNDIDSDESLMVNATLETTSIPQLRPTSNLIELITQTPVLDTNQQMFTLIDSDSIDSF